MRKLIALFLVLSLSACGSSSTFLTKEKPIVIIPDHEMFKCDTVTLPDPDTLTILETAKLIVSLKTALDACQNNMTAVEDYLKKAKARVESK
jgi:hypothetical protein